MTKKVLEILCLGLHFVGEQGCGTRVREFGRVVGEGRGVGVEGEGSVERGGERRKSANGWRKSKCTFCSPPIYV